ncbi:probable cysteine desulfurase [Methanocella paludicola SANAE]|uniref:Cysteine desulfurase IscS n=1 Tax=Methanocella paludicola (strain DSM 17711 / JCM 13418 / NBRC 101707 / SANAE) TaxID=304371 RepID=D1YWV6_METPS|nr:cysteine desulfurase NifS [Methanocella paludicola]BAI60928.1 probable cysteine desulfurase [Methanocella paludicola SANAE]
MRQVYLDNAATTQVSDEVLDAMLPYFNRSFGNASSLYQMGRQAAEAMEKAREQVANAIGADTKEVIFTSGGTESDNIAVIGAAHAMREHGNHIITSTIEHPAVMEPCRHLEKEGYEVTYLPVDCEGIVSLDALNDAVTPNTILISVMHVNNEIGTIQPIEEIGRVAKENDILFHTDAVQSLGKIPVDVDDLGVDLLSLSGHKIHGPKGIGALFVRKGTRVKAVEYGGGQERGLRSGTENIPGIVGMGQACEAAARDLEKNAAHMTRLRDKLIDGITKEEYVRLNGSRTMRSPNNANLSFHYIEGESLVLMLDMKGVEASTGSACSSKELQASHVLLALGMPPEQAHGSLRFTNSIYNTEEDIDYVLDVLPDIVQKLMAMSPLYKPY